MEEAFKQLVRDCIDSMPDRYRVVIILRYVEEMSLSEIATAIGVSLGTVKSRLSRAEAWLETHPVCRALAKECGWIVELIHELRCDVATEPTTVVRITFRLAKAACVTIRVLRKRKLMRRLADCVPHSAGAVGYCWDGTPERAAVVRPGQYTITVGATDLRGNEQKPLHVAVNL